MVHKVLGLYRIFCMYFLLISVIKSVKYHRVLRRCGVVVVLGYHSRRGVWSVNFQYRKTPPLLFDLTRRALL